MFFFSANFVLSKSPCPVWLTGLQRNKSVGLFFPLVKYSALSPLSLADEKIAEREEAAGYVVVYEAKSVVAEWWKCRLIYNEEGKKGEDNCTGA